MADGSGDASSNMPAPLVVTHSASFSKYLMSGLYGLRRSATFTDFTIRVQGRDIKCHKIILVAASPFFSSMLNCGLQEAQCDEVNFDQYEYDILSDIVDYIYSGNIVIPYKKIPNIIDISEFLQLPNLKEECSEYITTVLGPENCIGWFTVAEKYQLDKVMAHCLTLFTHSLDDVCMGEEFTSLSLDEMLRVIQKNIEGVESDVPLTEDILVAAMQWIKYEPESRNEFLPEIFKKIPLHRFEKSDIEKVRDNYQRSLTLRNYKMICDLMAKSFDDILSDFKMLHTVDKESNPKERFSISKGQGLGADEGVEPCLLVVGGSTLDDVLNNKCWCLRDSGKSWDVLTELPKECQLYFTAICKLENGFLVMGGLDRDGHLVSKSCHRYNAIANKWSKMPDMLTRRYGAGAAYCDGVAYVFGGRDMHRMPLHTIEYFDFKTETWTHCIQVLKAGYLPVVANSDEAVYVLCNFTKIGNSKKGRSGLWWYNIHKALSGNTPLPTRIVPSSQGATMIDMDGNMYIAGGSQKSVIKVTLHANFGPLPERLTTCTYHHNFGSVAANSPYLFISGGYRGDSPTDILEIVDTRDNKIEFLRLPAPLGNHFSCTLKLPRLKKSEF